MIMNENECSFHNHSRSIIKIQDPERSTDRFRMSSFKKRSETL